jgi:hypothetical protein
MDVNRRNLMKGVVTGGTLLALGIPPGALASGSGGRPGRFGLLLGNTPVDAAFAAGIRTAYSASAGHAAAKGGAAEAGAGAGHGVPQVVKLKGGLLNDYEEVAGLLEKSRNTRWVAVMDDGSAAVFAEMVRSAGAKLVLLGSHASSGDAYTHGHGIFSDIPELRHVWAAASPAHSGGGILASQLIANQRSFSIVENFFSAELSTKEVQADSATTNWLAPDFLGYRHDGPDALHLHCSGLLPSEGCESLGWNTTGTWTPVLQEAPMREASASPRRGNGQLRLAGWVESVGYAVMTAALGAGGLRETCSSRAFVHRSAAVKRGERIGPAERFTSFVIDI